MNRRGFLGSILAAAVAPAIVRADSRMRIVPRDTVIVFPPCLEPPLAKDVIGRVVAAQVLSFSGIDECVETWVSANKSIPRMITTYQYHALEVIIELAPGVDPHTLRADGRPVDLRGAVIERTPTGIDTLRFPKLDVTDYGNRIPVFQLEKKE